MESSSQESSSYEQLFSSKETFEQTGRPANDSADLGADDSTSGGPSDSLFKEFEASSKIVVPICLKNLIICNGFDHEILLKDITEADLSVFEKYARTELHKNIPKNDLSNFYGPIFSRDPSKFQIAYGHKKIIFFMRDYFKNKYAESMSPVPTKTSNGPLKSMSQDKNERSRERSSSSSSSVDFSNINLTEENKHIFSAIKKWANSKCKLSEICNFDHIKVCTSLPNLSDSDKMTCRITCFCGTGITIMKVSKTSQLKSRWIYANFYVHFVRKHIKSNSKSNSNSVSEPSVSYKAVLKKSQKPLSDSYSIKKYMTTSSTTSPKVSFPKQQKKCLEKSDYSGLDLIECQSEPVEDSEAGMDVTQCQSNPVENCEASTLSNRITLLSSIHLKNFAPISNEYFALDVDPNRTPLGITNSDQKAALLVAASPKSQSADNPLLGSLSSEDTRLPILTEYGKHHENKLEENDVDRTVDPSVDFGPHTHTKKWTAQKYSRAERARRDREKLHSNQTLLTSFFSVVQKINEIIGECVNLDVNSTSNITQKLNNTVKNVHFNNVSSSTMTRKAFLETLIDVATKNSENKQNIYDDNFKKFALYLFYSGGKLLYETLHSNMNNILPSLSTLYRYKNKIKSRMDEGQLDFEGLNRFLEERNLAKIVWISEDGTRINGKIEYDARTNTILGFVLPLNKGIPNNKAYLATSAEVIENYFLTCEKAEYAYCIMAQPLHDTSPAFCLSVFGTNNKFTYLDVSSRWEIIKSEAAKFGIKILGFSSDGDPRLLKAMKNDAGFPCEPNENEWYHLSDPYSDSSFIQDQTHILTKLRTRFLKPGIKLPMGKFEATVNHMNILIGQKSKDQHLLTKSDLTLEDKMNFDSARKMCSSKVQKLLAEVDNSMATIIYLKIMDNLINSFISVDQSLRDRIFKIWYCVFFLRIWRQWIKEQSDLNLQEHFITLNCYTCIEINAHMLLKLVQTFKSNNELTPDMFCPWLFSSQPCEALFRSARSMTSTFSTVINFSIKDFLSRIDRIFFINYVINDLKNVYIFPREIKRMGKKIPNFPTDLESIDLNSIVKSAMNDAINDAQILGMHINVESVNILSIPQIKINSSQDNDCKIECSIECDIDGEHVKTEIHTELEIEKDTLQKAFIESDIEAETSGVISVQDSEAKDPLELKDYSGTNVDLSENSAFLKINLPNDQTAIIKKSSFCWLLSDGKGRVSNDRLQRFITSKKKPNKITKRKGATAKGKTRKIPRKTLTKKPRFEEECTELEEASSEECDTTSESEAVIYDDSTDTESFSEDCQDTFTCHQDQNNYLKIELGNHYAVHYDEGWFIGLVIEVVKDNEYKMKFLEKELNRYTWPKKDDIAKVNQKFIFYGPVCNMGTYPFELKRTEFNKINNLRNNLYKISKKEDLL